MFTSRAAEEPDDSFSTSCMSKNEREVESWGVSTREGLDHLLSEPEHRGRSRYNGGISWSAPSTTEPSSLSIVAWQSQPVGRKLVTTILFR